MWLVLFLLVVLIFGFLWTGYLQININANERSIKFQSPVTTTKNVAFQSPVKTSTGVKFQSPIA